VIEDTAGNLYGTTQSGGPYGYGRVFKLAPDGTETDLYSFRKRADADARLIADSAGNLYGTTLTEGRGGGLRCGTVYKLTQAGILTVLHTFAGGNDGCHPYAGLIKDASGTLYGTTVHGGAYDGGAAFKIQSDGVETVLHSFGGPGDGKLPYAGLTLDDAGNLYGTTYKGGLNKSGIIFLLTPAGTETVLHSFGPVGGLDGRWPFGGVVRDRAGNLYGTTSAGGIKESLCRRGCGTVFRLAPDGSETVLHFFDSDHGASPYFNLRRVKGRLYGVTAEGGAYESGTVFALNE
jgi:uncharacterized repeat protein (TIGR03803 family)